MGKHHDLTSRAMSSVALEAQIVDNAPDCDRELLALWREYLAREERLAVLDEIDAQEKEAEQFWEAEVTPVWRELYSRRGLSFLGLAVKAACLLEQIDPEDYVAGHPVNDLIRTTKEILAGLSLAEDESGRPISLLGHRR
ncbi:hypothetical protein [Caenispirillum bisanense]|uniref:hypothetical protein n=1 Tax=Caenispirillum bisanense TaxID=414052 RepID=UPI0031D617E5